MTDYFDKHEYECKCGCGLGWTPQFHARMNLIREEVGHPMIISSGARCAEYDESVEGKGPHRTGMACDILCAGEHAHDILRVALKYGMAGIGVSQRGAHATRFIHLDDTNGATRPWVWTY